MYHPDIIIPSEKKIIEVKSTYTVLVDKNLNFKLNGCEDQGWVFDRNANLVKNTSFASKDPNITG